jgi:hypothetical protein
MIFKNSAKNLGAVTEEEIRADAQKKADLLRAMSEEFQDEEKTALTPGQKRLASRTSVVFLDRGADFTDRVPNLSGAPAAAGNLMRTCVTADTAYAKVQTEAEALVRQVRLARLRTKLTGVMAARDVYRVAKSYAQTAEGRNVRPHVEDMARALNQRPRRKSETPPGTPTNDPQK